MPASPLPSAPAADRPAETLRLDGVSLTFSGHAAPAIDIPSLEIPPGEAIGLSGPSGSGKTLLLHLMAGLRRPGAGAVHWGAMSVSALPESRRDAWRRTTVGMVFQDFQLVPELPALDNVLLPAWFAALSAARWRAPARALLDALGIPDERRPAGTLSRGEQQRVAVARALLYRPRLLLADEPTASLDEESARTVAALLLTQARDSGATLVVASHDPLLLARLHGMLRLDRGRLA